MTKAKSGRKGVVPMEMSYIAPILDSLLNLSCERQIAHNETKEVLSRKSWLKEFCTIILSGPRQSGHDWAAARLIESFNGNVWMIHAGFSMQSHFIQYSNNPQPRTGKRIDAFHSSHLRSLTCPGLVIVNNTTFVSRKTISKMYDYMALSDIPSLCNIILLH